MDRVAARETKHRRDEFPEIVLHIHLHIYCLGWTCVLGFNVRLLICISCSSIKKLIKVVESCETWQVCEN